MTILTVNLGLLRPAELGALVEALDRLKPNISEEAWQLAHALDKEEARRVERGEPVGYSEDVRPIALGEWVRITANQGRYALKGQKGRVVQLLEDDAVAHVTIERHGTYRVPVDALVRTDG